MPLLVGRDGAGVAAVDDGGIVMEAKLLSLDARLWTGRCESVVVGLLTLALASACSTFSQAAVCLHAARHVASRGGTAVGLHADALCVSVSLGPVT